MPITEISSYYWEVVSIYWCWMFKKKSGANQFCSHLSFSVWANLYRVSKLRFSVLLQICRKSLNLQCFLFLLFSILGLNIRNRTNVYFFLPNISGLFMFKPNRLKARQNFENVAYVLYEYCKKNYLDNEAAMMTSFTILVVVSFKLFVLSTKWLSFRIKTSLLKRLKRLQL